MARFILDTNIVSELVKPAPSVKVLSFLKQADVWVSTILFHELVFGAERCPDPMRKQRLLLFISDLSGTFHDRIHPVDIAVSEMSGRLRAQASGNGRVLTPLDALMAATAMVYGATLATRNTKDFNGLAVPLYDPFL